MALPQLSLTEWAVLCLLAERPAHGFDLARALAPGSELGWVWTAPRPLVYHALDRLHELGLITAQREEPGKRGPRRTIMVLTPAGHEAVEAWLMQPVAHVRDMRAALLLKLVLLQRAGRDIRPLLQAQQQVLAPIVQHLEQRARESQGAARIVALFRLAMAQAVLEFLTRMLAETAEPSLGKTATSPDALA